LLLREREKEGQAAGFDPHVCKTILVAVASSRLCCLHGSDPPPSSVIHSPGTEPKLKYYQEVSSKASPQESLQLADRLEEAVRGELVRFQEAGLTLPAVH
jgi:hypothetical protein